MLTPSEHYERATNLVVAAADFEADGGVTARRAERMVARAQVHALLAQCGDFNFTYQQPDGYKPYPETVTREPTGGRL